MVNLVCCRWYLAQQYIANPLLISGRKFGIRVGHFSWSSCVARSLTRAAAAAAASATAAELEGPNSHTAEPALGPPLHT